MSEEQSKTSELTSAPSSPASNSATALAPKTFHPFPRLPVELRLQIWVEGIQDQDPKVVEISWTNRCGEPFWFCPLENAPKPSPFLRTNKETRQVYLENSVPLFPCISFEQTKFYSVFSCTRESLPNQLSAFIHKFTPVRFNPNIDTIYVSQQSDYKIFYEKSDKLRDLLSSPNLQQNRFMAMDCETGVSNWSLTEKRRKFLKQILNFQKLEKLVLVDGITSFDRLETGNYQGEVIFGNECPDYLSTLTAYFRDELNLVLQEDLNLRKFSVQTVNVFRLGLKMSSLPPYVRE
jgi:hypothetical protein